MAYLSGNLDRYRGGARRLVLFHEFAMSRRVSDRKVLKTYRNIVLLLLAAFVIHVGVFPIVTLPYWIHWFFGAIVPGAMLVLAVYILPKRPWQE